MKPISALEAKREIEEFNRHFNLRVSRIAYCYAVLGAYGMRPNPFRGPIEEMGLRAFCPFCRTWHVHTLRLDWEHMFHGERFHGPRYAHCDEEGQYYLYEWPTRGGNLLGRRHNCELPIIRNVDLCDDPDELWIFESMDQCEDALERFLKHFFGGE